MTDKTISCLVSEFEQSPSMDTLLELLHRFAKVSKGVEGSKPTKAYRMEFQSLCTRITAAWARFLIDSETVQPGQALPLLHILHEVYAAGGGTDWAINQLHARTKGAYDAQNLMKLILLWHPATKSGIKMEQFVDMLPAMAYAQMLATVAGNSFVDRATSDARDEAIRYLSKSDGFVECDAVMDLGRVMLEAAYMHCSYSDIPEKHDIKQQINKIIQRVCGESIKEIKPNPSGKGRMVVVCEVLRKGHAMTRCFAKEIEGYRKYFEVIAVGWDGVDEAGKALFDGFEQMGDHADENAKKIVGLQPDVVLYPSVGMRFDAIVLSNYRLAPVQVLRLGHPATTKGSQLDYVVMEELFASDPDLFTEKQVLVNCGGFANELHPEHETYIRINDGTPVVAVSASAMKLNASFIDMLEQLEGCEVRFFTGKSGTTYTATANYIEARMDNAKVYPCMSYADYLEELAKCDLYASSVPFGGTNSILDAFSLGIPVVSMAGKEPHELIDKAFTEAIGLNLSTDSREEYVKTLQDLINDKKLRDSVSSCIRTADMSVLYMDNYDEYGKAIKRLI